MKSKFTAPWALSLVVVGLLSGTVGYQLAGNSLTETPTTLVKTPTDSDKTELSTVSVNEATDPLSEEVETLESAEPEPSVANEVVRSEDILAQLKLIQPNIPVDQAVVKPTPINGVYEVKMGPQFLYMNTDGTVLLAGGQLLQIVDDQLVNLTEQSQQAADRQLEPERAAKIAALDANDSIIFPAIGETRARVHVFTDIDCGFCRRLHSQMSDYQKLGIEVRYLAFPRAGIGSLSAKKLETTWCADDAQSVMTRYKTGENVPTKVCDDNPVAAHYQLGRELGVNGTPAIVLESGKLVPGAVRPDQLAAILGL